MRLRLVVVALAICACSKPTPAPDPGPVPPLPPLHPPTMESCDRAEETLARLDCRRVNGTPWTRTPAGAPFADACKRALADGRSWSSPCIARIKDCADLECAYRGQCCGETP
ncbi:MAG TPA: hypothetical protein VK540_08090 [Polyangiaceae bacterium]|nr:hypothetical protein [Polyangiaceae bacterium]